MSSANHAAQGKIRVTDDECASGKRQSIADPHNPDIDHEALAADFKRKLERQILAEIIPSIERTFRAVPDAKHRAMAGQSMGGLQAAFIGMNHPETFSTVGMWSSAVFVDPDSLKHSFLYVHLGVGLQDFLLSRSHAIDQFLASQKIVHEFTPTPGTHSWMVWRGYLVDFLTKFSAVAR